MLKGSAWMTAGSIGSRLLGAIYTIPWVTWMGVHSNEANSLFAQGYNIYNLFLIIATAGIPAAVSRLVAQYNGEKNYALSQHLYRSGLYVALLMGIISAFIMIAGARLMDNGDKDVIPVINSLAFAVLIMPTISVTRGYFQGYGLMAPSAISQFTEQFFRVIYMLVITYFIMKIIRGDWKNAVTQSTFAAFIGAFSGLVVLLIALVKYRKILNVGVTQNKSLNSTRKLMLKVIYQSIPFIIIESGITIYQLIDQYTFFKIMKMFNSISKYKLNVYYALFSFNANKLYMIIISIAMSIAATVIPILAMLRSKNDVKNIEIQIKNVQLLFLFIMVPTALGLYSVAQQIYTVFYKYDDLGIMVLEFSAFIALPLGLYTVNAAVMQGLSKSKQMLKYLLIGILLKLIFQLPSIYFFQVFGPLLSTGISMIVVNYLILRYFYLNYNFRISYILKTINKIVLFSLIMSFFTKNFISLINSPFDIYNRYIAFVCLIFAVFIGGIIYLFLVLKFRLADKIIGYKAEALRTKLNIK
ncbi:polysaccharide biosynthesis protein [Limosilactobacillus albertensis]|uniref:Polysaccharide biosynthesis protein n=1 Tax=Limosilactobacillus albertensis TaxID=2759752 RepID=A0A839HC12_9LACO|nr:polysaccharide biosynthesis protein [Limosilactobacillus albertensis]MBB1124549.1 polysaccharide biosynthesis protein [Limosilactobacillus albertensis]MCD7123083.1 polysaccharide biosynthesis protein [Limosilactobacillus albertensis]